MDQLLLNVYRDETEDVSTGCEKCILSVYNRYDMLHSGQPCSTFNLQNEDYLFIAHENT